MTIEVTQADRDASFDHRPLARITRKSWDSGVHDNSVLIQAFAAHRIAAESAIVEWLRNHADAGQEVYEDFLRENRLTREGASACLRVIAGKRAIADAIEKGMHRG